MNGVNGMHAAAASELPAGQHPAGEGARERVISEGDSVPGGKQKVKR